MTTIAIVGRGAMGRAHARAWNELGLGDRIRYVCSPGQAAALEHAPLARFVTDLDLILADPDVDVVSVCTPTTTHADIAIRSLRAGKNVLLEKPIALTLKDALAIRDVAERSPGVLMVAHVVRFFDGYRGLREAVENGAIGHILSARAERISDAPAASTWWQDESKSGGVLVDFSIHDFDQLNLFLGQPLSVHSRRGRADGPIEVAVEYRGGGMGRVLSFMGMPHGYPFTSSLEVVGSLGLADHRFAGAPQPASRPTNDAYRVVTPEGVRSYEVGAGNPYARQAEYFLECVRNGSDPALCSTDSAVSALAVSLAARDSLATDMDIEIPMG